jgi:DNA processing protein
MGKYEFWLRLLLMRGLRAKHVRQINVKEELSDYQVEQLLDRFGLTQEQIKAFYQPNEISLSAGLDWLSQRGHELIVYSDADYPPLLRHIGDAPLALFVKGNLANLKLTQLAMVGSRQFSHYGKRWGEYFASALVKTGFVITSGLALGIDSICHRAAMDHYGKTIAVLGSGLSTIAPKNHLALAERILQSGGTLVSEFLPLETARPEYFPKRNRIVSGLCKGVLIVEAALKSGSLITARLALDQGREVFVLPGPLGNPGYQGNHWLIQQGANLITHPKEIIEYLNATLNWLEDDEVEPVTSTDAKDKEKALPFAKLLSNVGDEITPIDIIAQRMSLSTADISLQLLELEISGYIASVQGGYVRLRRLD